MAQLDHLSYSSISLWQTCARAWRYRYVEQIPTTKSPSLAFGSAMHDTIEALILSHHNGTDTEPTATWLEKWQSHSADVSWDSELPEQWANDGIRILTSPDFKALLDKLSPHTEQGQPVIEKRIELSVPGVPIPVIGFIDLITADGIPCDIKTASRSWTQDQADRELQPLFYLAALNQAGYKLNAELKFRHIVVVKAKTPQVQVIESRRKPADLLLLCQLIAEVWQAISRGIFPPNPSSWKCSERYCEYYSYCRGG